MGPDVAKKRGDESKNYSPPIPPTRIPFLLTPDLFYVRFLNFRFFTFPLVFFSFLDPIGPHWTPFIGVICGDTLEATPHLTEGSGGFDTWANFNPWRPHEELSYRKGVL